MTPAPETHPVDRALLGVPAMPTPSGSTRLPMAPNSGVVHAVDYEAPCPECGEPAAWRGSWRVDTNASSVVVSCPACSAKEAVA